MNARERALAALQGRPVDHAPVAYVAALAPTAIQQRCGRPMPEVHHQPDGLADLAWTNHVELGFDAVSVLINYFSMPAALGMPMDWGAPDRYPRCAATPWMRAEDAFIPDDLLEREPIPTNLEAIRVAKARYGAEVSILGKVMGPLSLAQVMRGVDAMMMDLLDRPAAAQACLETCVQGLIRYANAQLAAGADAISIGEGGAGSNMISPRLHRRHLLPVHRTLIAGIQGPTILHICGDITPRLDALRETGLDWFNFDAAIEPKRMVTAAEGAFGLMGNVDTTDLLLGTPEEIGQQVRRCLEAGVGIISPGCAVSPNCPPANLRAMSEAVVRWAEGPAASPSRPGSIPDVDSAQP
jgi:MtaA/CmuA family methyltransferase